MPKSNNDTTQIFRSLGPDNSNFKAAANATVREAEHRWPMLKSTPPKKLDQTPDLSQDEKAHWLSPKKTITEDRKHALSVPSATSKEKLAASLKKMAGSTIKSKPASIRSKSLDENEIVGSKKAILKSISADVNKMTEVKKIDQPKKLVEMQPVLEEKISIDTPKVLEVKTSPVSKRAAKSTASSANTDGNKSLRGIFDRLTAKQPVTQPAHVAPVKSSVLSKLSKR
jgi:hypothetical protein